MPPRRSIADKLKKPLLIIFAVLFFGSGTLYYYVIGETAAPGFGNDIVDYEFNGLEIHFPDVGQGDCALLLCNEYAVLIDGGEYENGPFLVSYLKDHGVDKVDLMVASHRHSDHLGGLTYVLEQMTVSEILINPDRDFEDVDTVSETQFLNAAAMQSLTMTVARSGMIYTFDDMRLTVLSASSQSTEENDNSVVMTVAYDEIVALFTGDIGASAEKELLDADVLTDCDVLKMAHHGSNYSNSAAFLNVVKPEFAVASCGVENMYGHPGNDALNRFERIRTKVYRTDEHGTVKMTCYAGEIHITINGKETYK